MTAPDILFLLFSLVLFGGNLLVSLIGFFRKSEDCRFEGDRLIYRS